MVVFSKEGTPPSVDHLLQATGHAFCEPQSVHHLVMVRHKSSADDSCRSLPAR